MGARHRSPGRRRPRDYAIVVDAACSSMQINLSGPSSGWTSNHRSAEAENVRMVLLYRVRRPFLECYGPQIEQQSER